MNAKSFLLLLWLFFGNGAVAQQHGAHTHGEAVASIVFDEGRLLIELETPAANILGFEHSPQSELQKQQYQKALDSLNTAEAIFKLTPKCTLEDKRILAPFESEYSDGKNKTRAHDEHSNHAEDGRHEKHEGHGQHDGHKEQVDHKEHEGHKEHEEQHQDFHVSYEWQCPKTNSLVIEIKLFDTFSGFEEVQAQWIAFGKQHSVILEKNKSELIITP